MLACRHGHQRNLDIDVEDVLFRTDCQNDDDTCSAIFRCDFMVLGKVPFLCVAGASTCSPKVSTASVGKACVTMSDADA